MDPWKHEDRPSPGCESQLSSRTLRYGDHDRKVSGVRIVNGINKYVTEASEEIHITSVENRGTGILVAKAEPRPKPTLTLSCVSIVYRELQSRLF